MNILTIDVEDNLIEELKQISPYSFTVFKTANNEDELSTLRDIKSNICIIDIDNFDMDKFKLACSLHSSHKFIIFLTADYSPQDRVRLYSYGANLILSKPCMALELLYCTKYLYHDIPTPETDSLYKDENFIINYKTHEIEFRGTHLQMSPLLVDALILLVENRGDVLKREEMIDKLYKHKDEPQIRAIDTIITNLRRVTDPDLFETKRGIGYKYVA